MQQDNAEFAAVQNVPHVQPYVEEYARLPDFGLKVFNANIAKSKRTPEQLQSAFAEFNKLFADASSQHKSNSALTKTEQKIARQAGMQYGLMLKRKTPAT